MFNETSESIEMKEPTPERQAQSLKRQKPIRIVPLNTVQCSLNTNDDDDVHATKDSSLDSDSNTVIV